MPATHDATLHGVVFDVLVGRECRVGLAAGKCGLPSRSSPAAPAFAQVGFGAAAITRFASEVPGSPSRSSRPRPPSPKWASARQPSLASRAKCVACRAVARLQRPPSPKWASARQPSLASRAKAGGPGRTRTCNQTVMSGSRSISFVDFAALSFDFDRVRCGSFTPFLVRNWCGSEFKVGRLHTATRHCPMMKFFKCLKGDVCTMCAPRDQKGNLATTNASRLI